LPALTESLADGNRLLLQAPPGAGKSTLVPLALLDSPWLQSNKILMLEPRRIAARAVATRMAQLGGEPVGRTVGYRTRLDTRVSEVTRIEVVTEGILTRLLQDDCALPGVGCVIFDEFHERSLHADLGLALCLETQLSLREDLRIVVMSATLDLEPLARLLDDAPVIRAQGRSFDVVTHYVPRRPELKLDAQVAGLVRRALAAHDGDLLCFLPGAAEIGRVQQALESVALGPGVRILPLYGELAGPVQDAALRPAPSGERKIVLSTTIAETSLTIEGIRVVIDAGLRRYSQFDPATGMSRLVTADVSQAAADQRRGRAGRLSDGVCYRLWSEGKQASLAARTPPEILQADLAPLALELACWGAVDALSLRWLDPPPAAPLAQARDLLRQLTAIDDTGRVTAHGRRLVRVGAHPRLAHLLIEASRFGATRLACDLAAILSERDLLRAAPGARDADLRLRVAALQGSAGALPAGMDVDTRALALARRTSSAWQREFARAADDTLDADVGVGLLLALSFPDRIGRARATGGTYHLVNGRGARFAEPQALAKAPFIVAAQLDGADRDARIFLAAPVQLDDVERLHAARITEQEVTLWDERTQAVKCRRERRLGALLLDSRELADPDPARIEAALLDGIRQLGIDVLPWSADLRQWQARVALMRTHEVPAPEPWPDLSDAALLATLEDWAPPWLVGVVRRDHFARIDLNHALKQRLSRGHSAILELEAPTHFVVPSGSSVRIDYLDGEVPTLSVRLQEMFGLQSTPRVAAGRLPLLLKLLSPAGRPVQITRDLESFWSRGYHEVKKDLKGRYPKHDWPDDPHAATPTRRARPR
jgi:ATP-dependent helicase HrpB